MTDQHHKDLIRIGLNILYYRKLRGFTQEQLAERASYSKNYIQRIETAVSTPSIIAILDIAEALDVPPEKLLEER